MRMCKAWVCVSSVACAHTILRCSCARAVVGEEEEGKEEGHGREEEFLLPVVTGEESASGFRVDIPGKIDLKSSLERERARRRGWGGGRKLIGSAFFLF